MPFFRGSSQTRDQTRISWIAGRFFTSEPPGKPRMINLLSAFKRMFMLFSIVTTPLFIPTNIAGEFSFLHTLSSIYFFVFCFLLFICFLTITENLTFIASEKPGQHLIDLLLIWKIQKTEVSLKENESHSEWFLSILLIITLFLGSTNGTSRW